MDKIVHMDKGVSLDKDDSLVEVVPLWDVGGQDKIRPVSSITQGVIFIVGCQFESLDRK